MTTELLGKQLDFYRIDSLIGGGGMGTVYKGIDLNLARPVAIKVMHPQYASQLQFQQRFQQEAQAAARLSHPSIVGVYQFGKSQSYFYLVMELVPGISLGAYIQQLFKRNQVMKLDETLFIMAQVADALGYAHRHGVVHRDVKPDNILIKRLDTPERPSEPPLRSVVTDFGLAKLLEGGVETQSGTFMGTLPYMSPEQVMAKPLDGRSDIYALGVVLYQLATGQLPFDIKSPTDAVIKHLNETPAPPQKLQPGLPTAVSQVILKALAKQPQDRYATGEEFAIALRKVAGNMTQLEATAFAPKTQVVSMVTELHVPEPMAVAMPSRMEIDATFKAGADRVIVSKQGEAPKAFLLEKDVISIGRAEDCDIAITGNGVSRHHARLQRVGTNWQIFDLGSTNGTFLDDAKLLPDVGENWYGHQTLRVGPFFLQLKRDTVTPLSTAPAYVPGTFAASPAMTMPAGGRSSVGQISILMNPPSLDVPPGGQGNLTVELFNQGGTVDHFQVHVDGIPASWATISPDSVQLLPGGSGRVSIAIHPPEDSSAGSGEYTYRVVVMPRNGDRESASAQGKLKVKPFERATIDMRPKYLDGAGVCRVLIHNQGNAPASFYIAGRDPGELLAFDKATQQVTVAAGEVLTTDIGVKAKMRPLLGRTRTVPFEIQVGSGAKPRENLHGQFDIKPIIPQWLLPLLVLLLTAVCIAGGIVLKTYSSRTEQIASAQAAATATQGAFITATVEKATANAIGTSGAEQAAAATGTAIAATAVAQGDDDKDGLSNSKEAELGTDPQKADTDGDGLSDGEEVNQFDTNPKKQDSDDDTLLDGDEVNKHHTSPNNPDTDADGTPDGVEVANGSDPLQKPSPTPENTATSPATATSTPSPTGTATPTLTPSPTETGTPRPRGAWDGDWDSNCDYLNCGLVTLTQYEGENTVTGTFADGAGTIVGIVEDNRLSGTWSLLGQTEAFDFWLLPTGESWLGNWGRTSGWCGVRPGLPFPAPCGVSSWYGEWNTDCGSSGCSILTITQDGPEISGTYAGGAGIITGLVDGIKLTGNWFRSNTSGSITFFALDSVRFNGNFNGASAWCGAKGAASLPDTCLNQGLVITLPIIPIVVSTLQPIFPIIVVTPSP